MSILQGFQGVAVGGVAGFVLLLGRQAQLFKEDGAQLLGGQDVEPLPCQVVDLSRQLLLPPGELLVELLQDRPVQGKARRLHGEEHVGEGHFHVGIEAQHALVLQLSHHLGLQGEQEPRRRDLAPQPLEAQAGEAVDGVVAGKEVIRDHGVEDDGCRRNAVLLPGVKQGFFIEGEDLGFGRETQGLKELPTGHRLVKEGIPGQELIGGGPVVGEGEAGLNDKGDLLRAGVGLGRLAHGVQGGELHHLAGHAHRLRRLLRLVRQPGQDAP